MLKKIARFISRHSEHHSASDCNVCNPFHNEARALVATFKRVIIG